MSDGAAGDAPFLAGKARPRNDDPVVLPGLTLGALTDRICALALRERAFLWWWIALLPCAFLTVVLIASVTWLFWAGIGIWGVDWPVMWGFAILEYVWWIAIASGGTFISALFYLMRVDWRTSTNRIAESMTLCAAACAGIFPILHLGRPWLFYWLFPYPNTMGYWPQWRSPLLWDFWAILTYVTASVLFWYLGLIPDMASLRDAAPTRGKQILYGVIALGFRGTSGQWRHWHATYGVLAAIMAALVCSVHSIVGLDFAGGATIGWHSTQFPPLFIFGAFLSGFAMVIILLIPVRRLLRLEQMITGRHLDVLCRLMAVSSLALTYSYMMDAFTTWYGAEAAERTMFAARTTGMYWYVYWSTILFNVSLPQLMWFRRLRMNQVVVLLVCVGVIIGMWFERYEIVVTSLHRTHLPSAWGDFHGTYWDLATLLGTVGLFFTGMLLIVRLIPVVSMSEMRALVQRTKQ
ncbi:MAG: polysulfide reductase NrfD [Acetobacteraceae bacterium]|nr:polysulfide reductase NrfD [Acetobacteraceae bacterium]